MTYSKAHVSKSAGLWWVKLPYSEYAYAFYSWDAAYDVAITYFTARAQRYAV